MPTLARRQVAQYNNVLSRYNKDPNTPTLTAAQIRLMVDRFSVVRKASPPPVFPDPKQMAKYEQTIKRRVVNPLFRNLRTGLNEAQSIRQAHAALNGITLPATSIPLIEQDVDQYFKKLDKQNNQEMYRSFRDALGVDIRQELAIVDTTATLNQFRRENIDLIRTIPSTLHQDLYERMTTTFAEKPFSRAAMGKLVREQYGASGYNARRLARDQTSKATGQFNKVRQTGVGIEQYKWRTSQDNRVRPSHAAHEGKLFDWENPPAGTGHPGTDVNCRCSGQPEVPEALVAKWPKVKPKSKLPVTPKVPLKPQTGAEARERILSDKRAQDVLVEQGYLDREIKANAILMDDARRRLVDKTLPLAQRQKARNEYLAFQKVLAARQKDQTKLNVKFRARGQTLRKNLLEHNEPIDPIKYTLEWAGPGDDKRARDGIEAFQRLVPSWGGDKPIIMKMQGTKRAYYNEYGSRGEVVLNKGAKSNTIVHELGHAWEGRSINNLQQSANHLYKRTTGDKLELMSVASGNPSYGSGEKTRADKFFNAYTGRDYKESLQPQAVANLNSQNYTYVPAREPGFYIDATEITSIGIEAMFHNPINLAQKDPRLFDFVFNNVMKKPRVTSG